MLPLSVAFDLSSSFGKVVESFHIYLSYLLTLAATLLHFAPVNRLFRGNTVQVISAGSFCHLFFSCEPKDASMYAILFSLALVIIHFFSLSAAAGRIISETAKLSRRDSNRNRSVQTQRKNTFLLVSLFCMKCISCE